MLLVFYNFDWIARRTVFGGAIGYGAYSLSFALLESLLIFIVAVPFFLMLRKKQGSDIAKALIDRIDHFFKEHASPDYDLWEGGMPQSNSDKPWLWKEAWGKDWDASFQGD